MYSTSLHLNSNNSTTSLGVGTTGTYGVVDLEESYSQQIIAPANTFSIANKLFATDTSGVIHEIIKFPDARPSSNAVANGPILTLAKARTTGITVTTSPNGFSYSSYGRFIRNNNTVWLPQSSFLYEFSAASPSVISIFNSTVSTVN